MPTPIGHPHVSTLPYFFVKVIQVLWEADAEMELGEEINLLEEGR